ncbi:hypothetical protein EVAR_48239_1 [Eumeta japonica]|uniref:Uncharacterized protein n=1 Tax=Eumeta variegata TaxID=151549 RepID=A0A4C1YHR4_EUMVA|nr:hypothetical protein EVAR_48239_1 [Eumeta japonica]
MQNCNHSGAEPATEGQTIITGIVGASSVLRLKGIKYWCPKQQFKPALRPLTSTALAPHSGLKGCGRVYLGVGRSKPQRQQRLSVSWILRTLDFINRQRIVPLSENKTRIGEEGECERDGKMTIEGLRGG